MIKVELTESEASRIEKLKKSNDPEFIRFIDHLLQSDDPYYIQKVRRAINSICRDRKEVVKKHLEKLYPAGTAVSFTIDKTVKKPIGYNRKNGSPDIGIIQPNRYYATKDTFTVRTISGFTFDIRPSLINACDSSSQKIDKNDNTPA